MAITLIYWTIAIIIPMVVVIATLIFNARSTMNNDKLTPFECGFDPASSARIPFSLRFFILAVLFLVFDIEIALLMPIPTLHFYSPSVTIIILTFMTILLAGLAHEWNEQSLEWM
uniref:NADH-ubiquinone oxidoreductase chain 3 n=1 Tax=Tylorrhynchus heterochetus TaxID=3228785 RepID=A0A097KZL9_TYLHE|nr:NADH dehydrogenase subunit 3 [Tylorrhynchus heterochaetus]AIT99411.1 NADH dehydrogenase subunit 3 [Tylorrhynchus heterochaetus]